jgi:hypothetical protein
MADILTGKQLRAIDALMTGATIADAATAAGVGLRTLYRWRTMPIFRRELQTRASDSLEDTARAMTATMSDAPATIAAIMSDDTMPAGVRLNAAKIALENGLRLMELTQLMQRLEALEARYE